MRDFNFPECPVPDDHPYEYTSGIVKGFNEFASNEFLDNIQMRLSKEQSEELFKYISSPHANQAPGGLLLEPSTFLICIIGFMIIVASLILEKYVYKSRNGWKSDVWKHFWFVSNRFFVFLQLVLYLFCLGVLLTASVFFVLNCQQMRSDANSIHQVQQEKHKFIENGKQQYLEQAKCIYEKQVLGVSEYTNNQVLGEIEDVIQQWRNQSGINQLQKFDYEGLKTLLKGHLDRTVVLSNSLASLKISSGHNVEDEFSAVQSLLNGIRMQFVSLQEQMKDLIPNVASILTSNEKFEKEARDKMKVPVEQFVSEIEAQMIEYKERINADSEGAQSWFLWAKRIIDVMEVTSVPGYRTQSEFIFFVIPFSFAILSIFIGIGYSCKVLCRNQSSAKVSGPVSQKLLVGGFYIISLSMIGFVYALGLIMLTASPLSRTCSHIDGRYQMSFYDQVRPDAVGNSGNMSRHVFNEYGGYEQMRKDQYRNIGYYDASPEDKAVNFNDFISDFKKTVREIEWKIEADSTARFQLKATTTELARNVNQLKALMTSSGILPLSRQTSEKAEVLATQISILALELQKDIDEANSLSGCLEQTQNKQLISVERNKINMRDQFYNLRNKIKNSINKMLPTQGLARAVSTASSAMCIHLRHPYNGVWASAMFAMPVLFLVAINLLFTAKAVSVPAPEAQFHLSKWLDSLKMPRFYDATQPLVLNNEANDNDHGKLTSDPLVRYSEMDGGIPNEGLVRTQSDAAEVNFI